MGRSPDFWLNNFPDLVNLDNFTFLSSTGKERFIKILNLIAIFSIIMGIVISLSSKKKLYLAISIFILTSTIIIYDRLVKNMEYFKQNNKKSTFSEQVSNTYDTGVYLTKAVSNKDPATLNNTIYINNAMNFNKGDIIALSDGKQILETNIISEIQYTIEDQKPVLVLLNPLKNNYSKYTTKILKVSDSTPNIITPPNANLSIQNSEGNVDPLTISMENYPKSDLPNPDRYDWNLELSTYGGLDPGKPPTYEYQGQPYGDLKCRETTPENPMGNINVTEYDAPPTMYGTCNIGENNNNIKMTENQELTVSQRVDDLLFHKGNSQTVFNPMPVDTLPNDQEAFAHFCYRNPTNLVNPKYASIFVNDPEKFKLVTKLARATGTENGGGGGR